MSHPQCVLCAFPILLHFIAEFGIVLIYQRIWVIPGIRSEVAENRTLLGCYAASSGDILPTFSGQPVNPQDGTYRLSRNVGKKLLLLLLLAA